jgi:hypothetical protein
VDDVNRLRQTNPNFYQNIEQGDYLLMYAHKAVIYRKSSNMIVNVAPIAADKTGL